MPTSDCCPLSTLNDYKCRTLFLELNKNIPLRVYIYTRGTYTYLSKSGSILQTSSYHGFDKEKWKLLVALVVTADIMIPTPDDTRYDSNEREDGIK